MHYTKSKDILEKINASERILINCHKDPDPDSIGSALALKRVLVNMGKKVDVICLSPILYEPVSYLSGYDEIKRGVDFKSFDFSGYDLFLIPDTSSLDRVTGDKNINIPIFSIVIDHHKTNANFADINLIEDEKASVGEMLYDIFEDFGINIDIETADCLMAAVVGDTGAFKFPSTTKRTFEIVVDLINKGADKNKAITNIYRDEDFGVIKFWGEVLTRMQLNEKGRYVWSAVPYAIFEKCGKPKTGKETAASNFSQIVKGTDFGFVASEEEDKYLKISFRSRSGFDTSKIAAELGGGGHVYASGASIRGLSFEEAVKRLLEVVDKYAVSNK